MGFEYLSQWVSTESEQITARLNALAADGWEYVGGIAPWEEQGVILVMRRPRRTNAPQGATP
jgi:hypothetical protein